MIDKSKLVKVSTYAQSIGKSNELVRYWIRKGILKEDVDYVVIDGVTFIDLSNIKRK